MPGVTNTDAIGRVLYTQYAFLFETASLVLMVAMIGAIVLTHRDRRRSKSQSIAQQNARTPGQHAGDDRCWRSEPACGQIDIRRPDPALGEARPDPALPAPDALVTPVLDMTPEPEPAVITHASRENTDMPIGIGPYLVVSAILPTWSSASSAYS